MVMVRRMELFLGSHSIAVSGQSASHGSHGPFQGPQISISVGVGTHVNALTDGSYHSGRKGFIITKLVSQCAATLGRESVTSRDY